MRKILIVEDEAILRETYLTILSTEPYLIESASNGKEALEMCADTTYDVILLDLMMPIMNGVEFLQQFRPFPAETRVIILSNVSPGDLLDNAMKLGAHRSELKANLSPRELLALVRYETGSQ